MTAALARTSRRVTALAALVALPFLTACATGGGGPPTRLEGTTWRIVQVDGQRVRAPDDRDLAPHLRVISAEGQVHGATGCNRFSGPYMASGTAVGFGPLALTRMACLVPALADQERRIVEILQSADGYRIDGRWLWLMVRGEHRLTAEVW